MKLPSAVTVNDIVDASVKALEDFLLLSGEKRGLVDWLNGRYLLATSFGRRSTRAHRVDGSFDPNRIREAQRSIVALIDSLSGDAEGISLPAQVHITRIVDETGAVGWAAIDAVGLPLIDRAMALVLAVFLSRPTVFMSPPSAARADENSDARPTLRLMRATRPPSDD